MATHGKVDQQADAPKFITNASTGSQGADEYGVDVFAVDATEASVAGKGIAPGWVRVRRGAGALETLEVTSGGAGYANTDTINVVNTNGANAAASIVTDGTGVITAVTITSAGDLFTTKNPTVEITTVAGNSAVITATAGGRAGRVTYETLVALNEVTGDGADDTVFPDS